MSNPSGKRRKFRRSFPSARDWEERDERLLPPEHAGALPPPGEVTVTTCQRCQLPMLGGTYAFTLDGGPTHQNLLICEPCAQSLQRWLYASGPRAARRLKPRSKRPTEVVASLISRRRSKFSKRVDRIIAGSRRHMIFYAVCAVLLGVGLMGAMVAFFYVSGVLSMHTP
jgi:hypothetical protein